jgi:hypothetical protein
VGWCADNFQEGARSSVSAPTSSELRRCDHRLSQSGEGDRPPPKRGFPKAGHGRAEFFQRTTASNTHCPDGDTESDRLVEPYGMAGYSRQRIGVRAAAVPMVGTMTVPGMPSVQMATCC